MTSRPEPRHNGFFLWSFSLSFFFLLSAFSFPYFLFSPHANLLGKSMCCVRACMCACVRTKTASVDNRFQSGIQWIAIYSLHTSADKHIHTYIPEPTDVSWGQSQPSNQSALSITATMETVNEKQRIMGDLQSKVSNFQHWLTPLISLSLPPSLSLPLFSTHQGLDFRCLCLLSLAYARALHGASRY